MLGSPSPGGGPNKSFGTNINPTGEYRYALAGSLPDYSRLRLIKGMGDVDIVSVSLPFSNASAYVYLNGVVLSKQLQPAGTLEELKNSSTTMYYLGANYIYLKLQVRDGNKSERLDICKKELCRWPTFNWVQKDGEHAHVTSRPIRNPVFWSSPTGHFLVSFHSY